jgi:hypothetical protein
VKEDAQRIMDCGDIVKGYKLCSCTSCDEKKWLLLIRVVFIVKKNLRIKTWVVGLKALETHKKI